jgi:transcriptional regulator with XRE-family HTH domain
MALLKRLREARNLSKPALAKKLGVDVECINSWEEKEKEISVRELSSLAYAFGLSSEDLFDKIQGKATKLATNDYYIYTSSDDEDGWWGHFGVRLKGHEKSKWFPITLGTADSVSTSIVNTDTRGEWIVVETLNNRLLVLRPAAVSRLWILDDAQDEPVDDWAIPMDGYSGRSGEFYKALEEYYDNGLGLDDDLVAPLVRKDVEEFTDVLDLDVNQIQELVIETRIYDLDGKVFSHDLGDQGLIEIMNGAQLDMPVMFDFSNESFDLFIPADNVCLIDMPKRRVEKAFRELHSDLLECDDED